jgi:MoaA/NifB/PqqE/SkfB family radical SAM enzyme
VRNQVGNAALAELHTLDLAELVLCLLVCYPVDGEAALGVVDETEVLAGLLDGDNVHQSRGEGGVGADLAVNLDEALHEDSIDLAGVESVLQTVAEEDDQRQRVAELVRTGGSLGSIGTWKLSVLISKCRMSSLLQLRLQCAGCSYRTACPGASARGR